MPQAADPAVADQLAGLSEPPVAALLAAGLEDASRPLHRRHQALPLVEREGQGLLAVHVLAGPQGGQVHEGVPMVGRGVDDHVDPGQGHRLAVIGEAAGAGMLLARGPEPGGVDIAQRHHLAEPCGEGEVVEAHAPAADQQDPGPTHRVAGGAEPMHSGQG